MSALGISESIMHHPENDRFWPKYIIAQWTDSKMTDECISWARQTYQQLLLHNDGNVYSNYMDNDEQSRLENAYGNNLPRLQQLKNSYDPGNLFHLNQNIPPSA